MTAAGGTVPARRSGGVLTGTGSLVRLALRRDRILMPVWVSVFVVMASSSAAATMDLYPTVGSRVQAAAGLNSTPSLVAMYGKVYDPASLGAVATWKLSGFGAALVAVLAVILVVRHTRAEEESGRLELVGSGVVGRHATLTAALLEALAMNLLVALLTAGALSAVGLPAAGSLAFGLAWGATGLAFSGVAAAAAQVAQSARSAIGMSCALLGATYLLRALGDTADPGGPTWASWLSPIGWEQKTQAFAHERWWVLLLFVLFAAGTTGAAYVLAARRDLGAGLLPDRLGPRTAGPGLVSPLGLAWRLHRGVTAAWLIGFVVLGAVLGSIATNLGSMINSPQAQDFIRRLGGQNGLTDAFLAAEMAFSAVFASAYGVQAALRLRAEEDGRRAEPLLATGIGRIRWAASHLVIALFGSAALLLTGAAVAGASYASSTGEGRQFWRVLAAGLVQIPSVWVVIGLVTALFGWAPRAGAGGWVALVAFLLLGELGPLLRLNHWLMDLSPFAHTPRLPGPVFHPAPLLWLLLVAFVLLAAGLTGARRRDLASG
ncbi:MAG TPA: ABC transporter permease [Kineosporiaceae bacterium]|nr:ABC transporter permease [Kineosporiaceae bacterium]